ncbi:DNA repair exonuclease [Paenibacillus sp. JTLBN-2024]
MVSFKFIHAADLHLDSQFKGISGLSDNIRAYLRESTFASLERLTELAVRERADFMVISGDVYDAKDASLQAQLRFREALDRLGEHGIGVYVIHGNHDPLDGPRGHFPEGACARVWPRIRTGRRIPQAGSPAGSGHRRHFLSDGQSYRKYVPVF